ncbi:hypothetical protein SAMN05216167_101819 [Spirosoma endophyticum]|uniref:Chagasin family peptidase inhibitor I42 n=2 Tax=Spirosoma endophyticum TaxID=662367 RepID=A0A1I1I005_9BACT|nr:hypothetical protein SAMN05216167_101819 [Spirosoma endophyticum]
MVKRVWPLALMIGLMACAQTSQPSTGSQKTLRVSVGEIKDITLSKGGNGSWELIGASDNQEVVEVSRRNLAPAVDTLKRDNTGPMIFQIKGVTSGTANVVFTRKAIDGTGNGEVVRTYVVQVTAK